MRGTVFSCAADWFGSILRRHSTSRRSRQAFQARLLKAEPLEQRQLLAADPVLATGLVSGVTNDAWTLVELEETYSSMVVVATPNYDASSAPLVTRLRNVGTTSFEMQVQRADGSAAPVAGVDVYYVAVEEGVYTEAEHGIAMEAAKFTSTVTDYRGSWVGESRTYANSYAAPVVLGQVMSTIDPDFSAFWSRGDSRRAAPDGGTLYVGKHVGEDPDTTRADETLGYLVLESGSGTVGGLEYVAALGADTVQGVDDGSSTYSASTPGGLETAVVSQSGMDGGNGSWAMLYGSDPVGDGRLTVAVDEDTLGDGERQHTTEQVAYLAFGPQESNVSADPPPPSDDGGAWTFVSIPDFLNADIGDASSAPGWDGGDNSINTWHQDAIDYVLDAVAAEDPDFVLVAGDLVNGHWHADASGRRIFGPVGTRAQKAAAIEAAADVYYSQWQQRFEKRDLEYHAAVGDHEIGDNNWPAGWDKSHLVSTWKGAWANYFTQDAAGNPVYENRPVGTAWEDTAYAFVHNNALLVTVDVFRQDNPNVNLGATGSVVADVTAGQLNWLNDVLSAAADDPAIDHVIVQGHVPVLAPVRTQSSSGMTMPGGENTDFWQALMAHDVDLYFAGEVHDMTASNFGGVEQVAHGGIMGYARNTNYLVGTVDGDRIDLELKSIDMSYPGNSSDRLWQAGRNRPAEVYELDTAAGFATVGTLTIDKSSGHTEYSNRTGRFEWYGTQPEGLLVHLKLDESAGSRTAANSGLRGSANDGALEGDAAFVAGGKLGGALRLDGADDYVLAGTSPVTGPSERTASIWVQTTTGALKSAMTLGRNGQGTKWDVDVDGANGGVIEVGLGFGRTTGSWASVNDGGWHLVTTVLPAGGSTRGDVTVYVDGVEQYVGSGSQAIATAADLLYLGSAANSPGFQSFDGLLDDAAVWGEELTAGEIKGLFDVGDHDELGYDAGQFDLLKQVHDREFSSVPIDGLVWTRVSGLTGDAGLTGTAGQFTLMLDADNRTGVTTVPADAPPPDVVAGAAGEVGSVTVAQEDAGQWHTVNLQRSYQDPVVIMQPASFGGGHPLAVRVRNVTASSFQFQLDEWDYLDGGHVEETIGFMVVEAGSHALDDGTVIQAGTTTVDAGGTSVAFPNSFAQSPVVLSQVVSTNDPSAVVTRQEGVSADSFSLRLQGQESSKDHGSETVAWIAVQRASGAVGGAAYEVGVTPDAVRHDWYSVGFAQSFDTAPVLLAAMQTTDGTDTAGLRYRNLTAAGVELRIEEEQSRDAEISHTTESVGYVLFEPGGLDLNPWPSDP